mmetsp:Transcript_71032/g.154764  ORF Transcript_71032/g.154764 Transcript_71032/m.154764 type:complete len:137 (-) Transcript_71032:44-454(-)|eukprot:CAMPEP_0206449608 /NCGR_PEP_ID=MMETSP0324_2-20121206/18198_1 /ASSEMBLY_ACC=CAM_ASM_000836 /TAXON_ID=2866 /ORGANISM="Crypthecodinium cohnii, Strain Seligo" /LENGTH=136 /DNA_ID=CAMNT_0053919033 /DNA_START=62 /DNA_END=472 /DNA_ORIENTATION=-
MGFACYARWARCRGAHLSMWSRQMNEAAFGSQRRGLAAAAVLRAGCAEVRPALSFPEQSSLAGGLTTTLGCQLDDVDPGSDEDSLAEILDDLVSSGATPLLGMDMIEVQSGRTWTSTSLTCFMLSSPGTPSLSQLS